MHARAAAGFVDQRDGALLQHAGADAAEHMLAAVALEDDGVDAGLVQQLAEQQAGGAGPDDRHLRPLSHASSLHAPPLRLLPGEAPRQSGGARRSMISRRSV